MEPLESRQLLSATLPQNHWFASTGFLTAPSERPALEIAEEFLRSNADRLGFDPSDIESNGIGAYRVTDNYISQDTGTTHLYFRQQAAGLDVLGADLNLNLTSRGEVINVGGGFVSGLAAQADTLILTPQLDAVIAVESAARQLGYSLTAKPRWASAVTDNPTMAVVAAPGFSLDDIPLELAWVPSDDGRVELVWNMVARTPDDDHWFDLAVAADDGQLLWQSDWVDDATYTVLPLPAEAPHDGTFVSVADPHDLTASPFGWHDTDGTAGAEFPDTQGNNVSAQEDQDNNNSGGYRPVPLAALEFNFPFDPASAPAGNINASITNLFFWNNIIHDMLYQYGFDEAAGNFQVNNLGRGGLGNDAVQADALDGSGTNNANFRTPPDGMSGRMQMYRWTGVFPNRDSSFDNGIIAHEFGHGLSNRLTGGPANSNALRALQSGGMGEGWGDWLALMLLQRPTDQALDAFPIGTYALGQALNAGGIRRYPYSFDMSVDPLTFARFNSGTEVHDAGEIWCSTLWDMNWILIDKHGYDADLYNGTGGNNLALQLVIDGMKLQPANPSFLQARDAILLADRNLTGGANQVEIWTAFARRGMGGSAIDGGSDSTMVIEAFDVPDLGLHVISSTPGGGEIVATGVSSVTVTFEAAFDPATVDAFDLQINGVPADSVSVAAADSLTFQFNSSPSLVEGIYTISIDGDAIERLADGDGITPFSSTFRFDTMQLAVTDARPGNGAVAVLPFSAIEYDFNEPIDPASLGTDDLVVNDGSVTQASLVDADTVRYIVSGLDREQTLSATLLPGAVSDLAGNPTLGYSGNIIVDVDTAAITTPLSAAAPAGSLVARQTWIGRIGFAGDTDRYTVALDAGQLATVVVDPAPGTSVVLELRDPSGALLATATSGTGRETLLDSVPIAVSGIYTVVVAESNGTLGRYEIDLLLNATAESETVDGVANDTLASAQSLDGAFASLPGGGQRAVVMGMAELTAGVLSSEVEPNNSLAIANIAAASFVPIVAPQRFQQSFTATIDHPGDVDWYRLGYHNASDILSVSAAGVDSHRGTLADPFVELYRVSSTGLTRVDHDDNSGPGNDALIENRSFPVQEEYLLAVSSGDPLASGTYEIGMWIQDFGADPLSDQPFTGEREPNDTAETASDASHAWRRASHKARVSANLTPTDRDVFEVVLNAGDELTVFGDTSQLELAVGVFDAQGNLVAEEDGTSTGPGADTWIYAFRAPSSGAYFLEFRTGLNRTGTYTVDLFLSTSEDVPVPTTGDDFYSLNLQAGETVSLAVGALGSGQHFVTLETIGGTVMANGTAGNGSTSVAIDGFQATTAGTYLARVRGIGAYSLIVTRDAGFDGRANEDLSTAQRLDSSGNMLGAIVSGESDVFHLIATAGQLLTLQTATPGDGPNQPDNALDPLVELYDPAGILIASDDNSNADGHNALLAFTPSTGGNYRVRVRSAGTSTGDYTLSVAGAAFLPTVAEVSIRGTNSVHAKYLVPTGSGEQLRTVPVGRANEITLTFTRDVQVTSGDLQVTGLAGSYLVTGFSYDAVRYAATWSFAQPVYAEQFVLTLSDNVRDLAGTQLDGEWENPTDPSDSLASRGAGNGLPGGAFVFRFNTLPGDANLDNMVDGSDYTIWADGFDKFHGDATFADGDFNGDGFVTGADYTLWADNEATPEAPAAAGFARKHLIGTAKSVLHARATDAPAFVAPRAALHDAALANVERGTIGRRDTQKSTATSGRQRATQPGSASPIDWLREEAVEGLVSIRRAG